MDPDAVRKVIKRDIFGGALQVGRVDIRGDESPWSLGAAEKGVDTACAGADVQACEFTSWLGVRGGIQ